MKLLGKATLFTLLITTAFSQCSLKAMEGERPSDAEKPLLSGYGTMGNTRPCEAASAPTLLKDAGITQEAKRIAGLPVFTTDWASPGKPKHHTTLANILDTHDAMWVLVQSANASGGLRNTALIPADTYIALQKLEKALRKVIHLTWGALMLDSAEDLEKFRAATSAPYLFKKSGFEDTYTTWYGVTKATEARPATEYSFPDEGDTSIYVAQIRQIAKELDIDLTAQLNLHFDPIEKEFRKKMVEAYMEEFPDTLWNDAYLCMREIISKAKKSTRPNSPAKSSTPSSPAKSSRPTSPDRDSVSSFDNPMRTPAQRNLLEEIIPIRNKMKFDLLMDDETARSLDGGEAKRLIISIAERLGGSAELAPARGTLDASVLEAEDDKKVEDDIIAPARDPLRNLDHVPYGSHLKPITTAGYRASSALLEEYWKKTEDILTSAGAIIPTVSTDLPLSDRANLLFVNILKVVQAYDKSNPGTTWSGPVTKMLENLNIARGTGTATYTGSISELRTSLTDTSLLYLFKNNGEEVTLYALKALVTEYKAKTSSRGEK